MILRWIFNNWISYQFISVHIISVHIISSLAPLWEDSFTALSIPSEIWSTLLPHLYDHLFSQPSRTLIRSSFQSLQESVGTSVRRLGEYSLQDVNEFLSKWLVKPLSQLFVDLGDLDYQSRYVEVELLLTYNHHPYSTITITNM